MATPPASWIAWTASATVGVSRRRNAGLALDQVAADQRADVVDALLLQALGVGGRAQHGAGEVRAADRFALGDARVDLRFVEVEAHLAQAVAHAQRALLAVRQEGGQPLGHDLAGVVDAVAEDVQFAGHRRACIDGGDLDGGHHAHAHALALGDGLGDAADGVVVGQCQQLHAGGGGALHDLGGGQGAVGVGGVRLQIEARCHARSVCDRLRSGRSGAGRASPRACRRAAR